MSGPKDIVKAVINPFAAATEATVDAAAGAMAPDMPQAAQVEDPKVAPKISDDARKRAKAREHQRRYAGAGRAGTVMSDSGRLG